MADSDLPNFRRPPVVETVLGVQFNRIARLSNAHLGVFWKFITSAWSADAGPWTVTDAPAIEPAFERFGEQLAWTPEQLTVQLSQETNTRLQIRDATGSAMIQLQNGRLHYNWIGRRDGEPYPRYATIRPRFHRAYEALCDFLRAEGLDAPQPNQWEITYVNHIPKGTVWNDPRDWAQLLVGLPGCWSEPSAVRLESIGGTWHFEIPPQRGRLHVDVRHAKLLQDPPAEVLRLTLTARGPVAEETSLGAGLDLGRIAIVSTFRDITSPAAHQYWGLQS